ncbi:MAG: hypothetical protein V7637_1995, partial [Mycobacteriales bacterium]
AAAGSADYLLLADCFLVLNQVRGGPQIITDEEQLSKPVDERS